MAKKVRKPSDKFAMILIFVISFGVVGNVLVFLNHKPLLAIENIVVAGKSPSYFPTQYSDKHITEKRYFD
jgi:hypothetical protein